MSKPPLSAFRAILRTSRVVPVLVVDRVDDAEPLAEALCGAGLKVLEVTLRTPAALEVIRRMKAAAPGVLVGAGTVLSERDVNAALEVGSDFIVTPGTTPRTASALLRAGIPVMPGVSTPSEALARLEEGFEILKFFPAEQYGGPATLKAMAGPLAGIQFCPTGGVGRAETPEYLAQPNVIAVGGSWVAPAALLKAGDWAAIAANAATAAGMGQG